MYLMLSVILEPTLKSCILYLTTSSKLQGWMGLSLFAVLLFASDLCLIVPISTRYYAAPPFSD